MIIRTPPPQRKRRLNDSAAAAAAAAAEEVSSPYVHGRDSSVSGRCLVAVSNPAPISTFDPDAEHLVCTYQCRQMVKSEFMDALNTAEKQVADYELRVGILTNDLQICEKEGKKNRDNFLFVEQELEASKGREKALQEQLLKEVNDSQEHYRLQLKCSHELEVQLKKEAHLRENAESLVCSTKEEALDLKCKLQQLTEDTERERIHKQKEFAYLQDESKISSSRINANLERMQLRAENSEKEATLLKKQLDDLRKQLNECLLQKSELEHTLRTCTAISHDDSTSGMHVLVKNLQEELRNYEAEVQEARKLKSSHADYELLKEKLLEEKGWRERIEKELLKFQDLESNTIKMEQELSSCKSLLKEIPGASTFDALPQKFADLQNELLKNMLKVGEFSANLKKVEVTLESSELGRQHAEKESALANEKAKDLAFEVKRLELILSSLTKDRDAMKDTCPLDEHIHRDSCNVQGIDTSIYEKEKVIRELENNINHQREVITRQHEDLRLLNEKLTMESRKLKSLERENERFCSEISLLESKLGHGDYSTSTTKVLRMVNTLAVDSDAKHTIDSLRNELQKAQAKLQAIEELKGKTDIPEKLAQYKGQIATLEKREERYKSVFAEKISLFRRACCLLFGYKIVMDDRHCANGIPVTRFSLQSIYAQTEDEKLEFDYESGNMNILANDYTSQRDVFQQVEIFIRKWNSIPAFTANLMVESFNKQTCT